MTDDDLKRLNTIADRAFNQVVTVDELKEFNQLLTQWEELSEITFSGYHSSPRSEPKKY
jgi:hypothetical protein